MTPKKSNPTQLARLAAILLTLLMLLPVGVSQGVPPAPGATNLPPLPTPPPGSPPAPPPVVQAATSPVSFEQNLGQWNPEALYKVHAPGYTAFLSTDRLALVFTESPKTQNPVPAPTTFPHSPEDIVALNRTAVFMRFEGATLHPVITAEGLQEQRSNYFLGNDPNKWVSNVPHYTQITYHGLYPGIDLVFFGNATGQLKYDFVIHPGGLPSLIHLRFEGLQEPGLRVEGDGSLAMLTSTGTYHQGAPYSYQETPSGRVAVENHYLLSSPSSAGFAVGLYDATKPLIVDPLVYSTLLGGSGQDSGHALAVDSAGNAYAAGTTPSTNYPTTSGAYQTTLGGGNDVFVTKLNPSGSGLVYSTFLGGSGSESAGGVVVNAAGNLYISGSTSSTNFPTTSGAFQSANAGGNDVFVAKLNPSGSALVYATLVGGSGSDSGNGLAVDSAGDAYVGGSTSSTNYPTTSAAYRTTNAGGSDGFVTKLNPTGTGLLYSTLIGGSGNDYGNGVAINSAGNAFLAGETASTNYPTTAGAYRTTSAGNSDAYVTKFNSDGTGLVYSTLVGGSNYDAANGVGVDGADYAYIAGEVRSSNFPTTSGAFRTMFSGGYSYLNDAFVTKFNPTGTALSYSTFLGGAYDEIANGIVVDEAGSAFVVGHTGSGYVSGSTSYFPTTSGAYQTSSGGYWDAFYSKLRPGGASLAYSTYLGKQLSDYGSGIAMGPSTTAVVTGSSENGAFPTTSGAYQRNWAGGIFDGFVAKVKSDAPASPLQLTTSRPGVGQIRLDWQAPTDSGSSAVTGYRINRGDTAGSETFLASVGNVLTYTDSGLPSAAARYYRVSAVNSYGEGDPSSEASSTTFAAPTPPQNLAAASGPGLRQLTLSWQAPPSSERPVTGYKLYRGTSSGTEVLLASLGNVLSYANAGLADATMYYYKVKASSDAGDSALSNEASATTYSSGSGVTALTGHPTCTVGGPANDPDSCNSERFGYTDSIDHADAANPAFTIQWGDFNGHEHLGCGTGVTCRFWMEFNLSIFSPSQNFDAYNNQVVTVAQLEKWDSAANAWVALPDGQLNATLLSPDGANSWGLHFSTPSRLMLTSQELGTHDGAATFRLHVQNRPGSSQPWTLVLNAAEGQLVAPPLLTVHGWSFNAIKESDIPNGAPYREDADFGTSMAQAMIDRSKIVYGQDPWNWSVDKAIINPFLDSKDDFRLSAFVLFNKTVDLRQHPAGPSSNLVYNGPVNIVSHSMGGLMARYMIEDVIPGLKALNHGSFSSTDAILENYTAYRNYPLYDAKDLVASVVAMGTPNLGSPWPNAYITTLDSAARLGSCAWKFWASFTTGCDHYYITKTGSDVISYAGPVPVSIKPWWQTSVGAYRNPAILHTRTSVVADFELMSTVNGNPVLDQLATTYAPAGIRYFHMAGDLPANGDGIVTLASATNDHDSRACWREYSAYDATYGYGGVLPAFHSNLPSQPKLIDDALVFMAGEKSTPCQNQPAYASSGMEASGAAASSDILMMDSAQTTVPSSYSPPINTTLLITGDGIYSMRLTWTAPGASNGTLNILGMNGTLAGATAVLRSPSGTQASLAAGNTTWATWTGPTPLGFDHILGLQTPTAQAGTWTLWLNRTSAWPGFALPTLTFDSTLTIDTQSDTQGLIGQPVTYRVSVTNNGAPVTDAAVTLQIDQLNQTERLVLQDDGAEPDAQAGDGIYSGQYTFQANGSFPYHAQATVGSTVLSLDGGVAIQKDPTPPPIYPPWSPANLTALRGPGGRQVTLSWQAPQQDGGSPVTGYRIYRGNATSPLAAVATVGNVTTYTDFLLISNTTYTYNVTALNQAGESALSMLANATTHAVLGSPLNVAAVPASAGQITLMWEAPPSNGLPVANYTVYRSNSSDTQTPLVTLGNITTYLDSGLGNNRTWYYQVQASNSAGSSPLSQEALATTIALLPGAPLNLVATPGPGAGQIQLSWASPSDDGGAPVAGYNIYRGLPGNPKTLTDHVGAVLAYTDSGLSPGTNYSYAVSAINAVGEGPQSTQADAGTHNVPGAPRVLQAAPGLGTITISWQAPSTDGGMTITGYRVYTMDGASQTLLATVTGLNYTHTNLGNGIAKSYRVTAINAVGESARSNEAGATTYAPPSTPTSLTATPGPGPHELSLAWQAPATDGGTPLTGYTLYRGSSSNSMTALATLDGATLSYVDSGLANAATFHYQVTASNIAGESPASSEVNATTFTTPSLPRDVEAVGGIREIALSWEAPSTTGGLPVTGYKVYRSNTTAPGTLLATLGIQSDYTDTGLGDQATWHYTITALNAAGEGPASMDAVATTKGLAGSPHTLTAMAGPQPGQISLAWQAPESDGGSPVTHYRIHRATTSGGEAVLVTLGNVLTYTDTGLGNAASFYYEVSAISGVGESARSNEANATTFTVASAPQGVSSMAGPGVGQITLTWQAPTSDGGTSITGYTIYRGNGTGTETLHAIVGVVMTYTDTGLPNHATRYYRVAATNLAGTGAQSTETSSTTFNVPDAPQGFAVAPGPAAGQITLSWQAPTSDSGTPITGYKVYGGASTATEALLATTTRLSYQDSSLGNAVTHYYHIAATNLVGEGSPTPDGSAATYDVPTAPQSVAAEPGVRQVALTWQAPTSEGGTPITGYKVYRTQGTGTESLLTTLGDVHAYTDSGLPNSTSYSYRIRALNLAGSGAYSDAASAATWSPPGAPQTLTAEAQVEAVHLAWIAPLSNGGTNVTGYTVYRGLQAGNETYLASLGNVLFYQDTTVHGGSRYYYRVSAVNAVGEGIASLGVSARPYNLVLQTGPVPIPPAGPMATVTVCDAGSAQGCQVPGQAYLCIQLSITTGSPTPLACVDQATIPPEASILLKSVSPVQVAAPPGSSFASAPSLGVLYKHERLQLVPLPPLCSPIPATASGVSWLAGAGPDTILEIRINGTTPAGQPLHYDTPIPYLGQAIAAAQATRGVIPC